MTALYGNITCDGLIPSDPVLFNYDDGLFTVRVSRILCAVNALAYIYCDDTGETLELAADFNGIDGDRDRYSVCRTLSPGLYYVTFRIVTDDGEYFVHSIGDEITGYLRKDIDKCGRFQVLITGKPSKPDDAFREANMYHIFVDRFRRSGKCRIRDSAVYIDDWYNGIPEYTEYPGAEMENNTFFGGDLYGIAEKLTYIKSLGCDILYLSPIFEAYTNHRYDTGDYMKIDEQIGGEEAFSELCKKAHKLGIKIILDGVFNHTGTHSVYFNKYGEYGEDGAYNSKDSRYYGWYEFREWPDDYECWWGVKSLPKLKHDVAGIHELICGENGVIRKYLRLGADGFRLDVADELSESLLDGIKKAADEEKPGSLIIGEVWEDASNKISYGKRRHYFSHSQLDSVMDYPLREAIIHYVKTGDSDLFRHVFCVIGAHYPDHVKHSLMNFLGSHDTERIMTVLGGDPAGNLPGSVLVGMRMDKKQYDTARRRFVSAFALLCFCPGIACVYYGDEAGMQGYRDPFNRMPYPWGHEDRVLKRELKTLLHLRRSFSSDPVLEYAYGGVIVIRRGKYVFMSNYSDTDTEIYFGGAAETQDKKTLEDTVVLQSASHIIIELKKEQ